MWLERARERERERNSFLLLRKSIKYAEVIFLNRVRRAFKHHTWDAIMRDTNSLSRWRKNCKNGKISRNLSIEKKLCISRKNHPQDISMSNTKQCSHFLWDFGMLQGCHCRCLRHDFLLNQKSSLLREKWITWRRSEAGKLQNKS